MNQSDVLPKTRNFLRWPPAWAADLLIALFLFLAISGLYSSKANPFKKDWTKSTFYEKYYGAAVLSACGHGWVSPKVGQIPVLDEFLLQKADSFDCSELPKSVVTTRLNYQAASNYYLFRTVELTWRLLGRVSWSELDILLALLCGLVTALYYMIFRLGMGPPLSLVGALGVLPLHIHWAAHLRDYGKVPFFLVIFIVLGYLVSRPFGPRRTVILASVMGGTFGVGLGFRSDILIAIPFVLMTLVFFLPVSLRKTFRSRMVAIAAFALFFLLASAPLRSFERTVHPGAHMVLQGLANRFTQALGVENSLYEWSNNYSDPWPAYQIQSYAFFGLGLEEPVPIYSEVYARLSTQLLLEFVARHPADFLIRAYASTSQLIKSPVWFALSLLVLVGVRSRLALFLALFILFFGGYPAAQFHQRHYFHLEFLPFWLAGLTAQLVVLGLVKGGKELRSNGWKNLASIIFSWWRQARTRMALGAVVGSFLVLVPLLALRAYQTARVSSELEGYENAATRGFSSEKENLGNGLVLLVPTENLLVPLPTPAFRETRAGYIAALVRPDYCSGPEVGFTLRYQPGSRYDFSRHVIVSTTQKSTTFAPIYSRERSSWEGDSPFLGIEISPKEEACVTFSTVPNLSQLVPIHHIELPEDWREHALYQRLRKIPGLAGLCQLGKASGRRWLRIFRALRPGS